MIGQLIASLFHRKPAAITAVDARTAVDQGNAVLLDVREPSEWQVGHAAQAEHLPLAQLSSRLDQLPHDRQIITVCRSGRRSAVAAQQLTGRGYRGVNLTGGMNAWAAAGLPIVTDTGRPGRVS